MEDESQPYNFSEDLSAFIMTSLGGVIGVPIFKIGDGWSERKALYLAKEARNDKYYIQSIALGFYEGTAGQLTYWPANALGKGFRKARSILMEK